jgi:hypothetical protein
MHVGLGIMWKYGNFLMVFVALQLTVIKDNLAIS